MDQVKEVSLREVFLTIGSYLTIFRQYWYLILTGAIALAAYFVYSAKSTAVTYEAPLTFVVNEESSGGGGFGSILGQFGLGGASSGGVNIGKILALAESQKIMNDLLLDSVFIDGVHDKFGNHIIRTYKLDEEWELEEVRDIRGDSLSVMSRSEKRLLKRLYRFVLQKKEGLLAFSSNEATGILEITASTVKENLSLELAENLYRRLSDFYTMESVGNSITSVTRLRYKADSIKTALDRADYSLATSYDRSQGVNRRSDLVRQAQLNREVQLLQVAYGEVVQNLEKARFMLNSKTPFFQTVDEPFLPLEIKRKDWLTEGILGFFLGGFLVFLLIAVKRFYSEVMNSEPAPN